MLDVYLLTLGLAVGVGLTTTALLLGLSQVGRFAGLFHARGLQERPRWGGAVIFITFAATPFLASYVSDRASEFFTPKSGDFLGLLATCFLIFLIGFFDDLRVATYKQKFLVQFAAATAVWSAGYSLDRVGLPWGPEFSLGPLSFFATLFWIVLFTNAPNMVDGHDGVALGTSLLAAAALAQIGSDAGHPAVALLLLTVTGGALGLLPFNLPPAAVFLGDSGAYLVGFIVGSLSIRAATGPSDAVFVAVPLLVLGFPILDTMLAGTRRLLDRRHPFLGDEDHIHHRLMDAGLGPRGVLVVVYAISAALATGAIVIHYVDQVALEGAVLLGVLLLVAALLFRLGYVVTMWNSESVVWLRRRLRPAREA